MPIKKIEAGRVITQTIDTFIGQEGTIFYDEFTCELRLSDGINPGGIAIGGNGGSYILHTATITRLGGVKIGVGISVSADGTISTTLQDVTNSGSTTTNAISIANTTNSTSSTTGALVVAGGVGIGGDIYFAGNLYQNGTLFTGGGGGSTLSVATNTGLTITNTVIATVYNSLISDDVQSVSVGGAASALASTWKSKNIVEVLDTILFPDVLPTYTIPTLTVTGPQSGTKEIGSTVAQALTLIGAEGDASTFTALTLSRNGSQLSTISNPTVYNFTTIADQFGYTNPNNPSYSYALTYTDNFVVVSGNTVWSGTGTYSAGSAKKNNKNVTDTRTAQVRNTNAPQSASSISSNSLTVTGIYPYFWGKSNTLPTTASIAAAILAGSTNKVLLDASGTVSVTFAAAGQYVWMAHAASYTSKTKWFNTQLNQGNIGAGNFILSPVTQSVSSPDSFWSGVSFKVYISSGATNTDGIIQFTNT